MKKILLVFGPMVLFAFVAFRTPEGVSKYPTGDVKVQVNVDATDAKKWLNKLKDTDFVGELTGGSVVINQNK